ncbi:MAG: hypothetical protein JO336_18820 [Acidobacteriia bacterium]|nr:hypothetical protein [Terriglobia bacterium]
MKKATARKQSHPNKRARRIVPQFATEAEEAEWWYQNRHIHDKLFHAAVLSGEAQVLTKEKLLARIAASKAKSAAQAVSIRIPAPDLEMARRQAARKGLPYQTYIKSLLHESLLEHDSLPKKRSSKGR